MMTEQDEHDATQFRLHAAQKMIDATTSGDMARLYAALEEKYPRPFADRIEDLLTSMESLMQTMREIATAKEEKEAKP